MEGDMSPSNLTIQFYSGLRGLGRAERRQGRISSDGARGICSQLAQLGPDRVPGVCRHCDAAVLAY